MLSHARSMFLALIAGFAITIAIAWSLAAFLPQRNWKQRWLFDSDPDQSRSPSITEYRTQGAIRRLWQFDEPGSDRFFYPYRDPILAQDFPVDVEELPPGPLSRPDWGRMQSVRQSPSTAPWDGCEHATGWPVVALWYEITVTPSPPWILDIAGGLPLQKPQQGYQSTVAVMRALPWRPIWIGLAIDSVFWGLIAFGASRVIVQARARIRLRRNRCPRCAYSLAGQSLPGCPECGWKRNPSGGAPVGPG